MSILIVSSLVIVLIFFPPWGTENSDTTDPTIEITSPIDAAVYYNASQLLNITAEDNIQIDNIWYNWDGSNVTYNIPVSIIFNVGTNTINAWTNDTAGNVATTSVTFTIVEVFTSTWNTSKISIGSSNNDQIRLPLEPSGIYNFFVDWGDGSSNTITAWNQAEINHTYPSQGQYTITINGTIKGWRFNNEGDRLKLLKITQWGNLSLGNSGSYFYGCENLNITASDILNLDGTTNLYAMFAGCFTIEEIPNMGLWDVSSVINMVGLFAAAPNFNQDIGNWDVSNVTDMRSMFESASSFNQDIGNWDVSGVTNMSYMFFEAEAFNQFIGNWDVSGVTTMDAMFDQAIVFNQSLENWNVSRVTNMRIMFSRAEAFNQNIGNWNVSRVTDMEFMFSNAYNFNQDIGNWDVSSVANMMCMFSHANNFNRSIGNWDVSSVTNMLGMFLYDTDFNQNISNWNVSSVTSMDNMLNGTSFSTNNYDSLLIEWSQLPLQSGVTFSAGNTKYTSGGNAEAARIVIEGKGWIIQDGGPLI
ncbi:BspA family leucine-rich repeat surface protein [Promethearchaeum syntrophicum]|uniref:BspA family leucine-rich repeat surface protein n=1 Tax=Promethearchaeum syntrophicum TaxID=2594042 RepID=A0A5B9DCG0_9ARCH|nr:BspA family leucine-rich repeat surface protein [Candidatus Prometheoarchaeum syntrophicum]